MPQQNDETLVDHLVELGYVDPEDLAAREGAMRREQQINLQRGAQLLAQGDVADAAHILERIAAEDANWIAPRQLLAEAYYRLNRFHESKKHLDWLTQHGVESPRLALLAGGIALSRREIASAVELLDYASYAQPGLPGVHRLYGAALFRARRLDESADAFRECLRQNANDARAFDGLSAICLLQANFEEAADWALRALEIDMRHFEAHYHLGLALAGLGRPEEARQALETSARVDPARSAPYRWLAKIARQQSDNSQHASRYLQRGYEVIRQRRQRKQGK